MTVLELIRGARELISDPRRWTSRTLSRNADGVALHLPAHPDAVRWCAVGALQHIGSGQQDVLCMDAQEELRKDAGYPIWQINDGSGHAPTLEAFDMTIARLETEELEAIPVQKHEHERQTVLA